MMSAKESFDLATISNVGDLWLKIEKACMLGQFELTIKYGQIPETEFKILTDCGYEVRHIQASYTVISWRDANT